LGWSNGGQEGCCLMADPIELSITSAPSPFNLSLNTAEPFVLSGSATELVNLQLGTSLVGGVSLQGPQGEPSIRGISNTVSGKPFSDESVIFSIVPYNFTLSSTSCEAKARVAALAEAVFEIYHTDLADVRTLIGTITFAAGSKIGVFSNFQTSLLEDELLEVMAPTIPDDDLQDIAFLLAE
jgi:hypothetical protein